MEIDEGRIRNDAKKIPHFDLCRYTLSNGQNVYTTSLKALRCSAKKTHDKLMHDFGSPFYAMEINGFSFQGVPLYFQHQHNLNNLFCAYFTNTFYIDTQQLSELFVMHHKVEIRIDTYSFFRWVKHCSCNISVKMINYHRSGTGFVNNSLMQLNWLIAWQTLKSFDSLCALKNENLLLL